MLMRIPDSTSPGGASTHFRSPQTRKCYYQIYQERSNAASNKSRSSQRASMACEPKARSGSDVSRICLHGNAGHQTPSFPETLRPVLSGSGFRGKSPRYQIPSGRRGCLCLCQPDFCNPGKSASQCHPGCDCFEAHTTNLTSVFPQARP